MNIGKASKLSGLTVKATRYYANINLVKPRQDIQTGYRMYTEKDVLKLMSTVFPNVGDLFVIVDDSPKAYPESIQGHVYHIPAMQPRDSAMLDLFTDLYQFKMKYFKSYGNQVTSFQPHVSTFVDQMKLEALKGRNIGLAKYVVTGSRRS